MIKTNSILIQVWDTGVGFKCVQTLSGHDGLILTLCPFEYVSLDAHCLNLL